MKVLLTGAGGMLGKALAPCLEERGHSVKGIDKDDLDITNYQHVDEMLPYTNPDLVIHAAAYTNVDQAESEPEAAFLTNGYGTENIVVACAKLDIPLLYLSTDYVFDGQQNHPYSTWDPCNPLSIYGKSKLAGEKAVRRHLTKFYIVRTSWLYGPNGRNFVNTIQELARQNKPLRVVSDQWGSPTCTLSLAECLAGLIATERWGIYHATDGGVTNWCGFAREILRGTAAEVQPIATKEFPRPATRPKYSVLDKTTLIHTIGRDVVPWEESLRNYLDLGSLS